jgi:mono/diheme cytochrome c family protein
MIRSAGYTLAGLLIGLLLVGGAVFLRGRSQAHATHAVEPRMGDLRVAAVRADSARLARGNHLASIMGCRHCHGADLGGAVFADDPPLRLVATNLTAGAGGIGRTYGAADWARAIRHGVGPDGEPLLGMPSVSFHRLSDADTEALVAYLQQIEPVDRRLPPTTVKPLGALLIGVGQIDPAKNVVAGTDHPEHVPVAATAEHGAYLYGAACQHCHGADLRGGPHPDPTGVAVPSLRDATTWSRAEFERATTQGLSVDGDSLADRWMPWSAFASLSSTEMTALYRYVRTRASDAHASTP